MNTSKPDKKTAMITGATGAIGKAIARQMAGHGFEVTLIARDEIQAKKAVDEIIAATGNRDVNFLIADLSRKSEIIKLAENWSGPLDVLINNAAARASNSSASSPTNPSSPSPPSTSSARN